MLHNKRIREVMKNKPPLHLNAYLRDQNNVFNFLLLSLDIPNTDKPITEKALRDPNSAEVCTLLYLYSSEPPFYYELNKACRNLDHSLLTMLGPYA